MLYSFIYFFSREIDLEIVKDDWEKNVLPPILYKKETIF